MRLKTFREAFATIGEEIAKDSFHPAVGGIFLKKKTKTTSLWISIAGNDYAFLPVMGVSNKDVDRIVNRALSAAIPAFKASKLGTVPLYRVTPERISPDDARIIKPRKDKGGYLTRDIENFIRFLREVCFPFMEEHCTLQAALDMALRWNKFDQAQTYYIPAMMLLLGFDQEEKRYVNEVATSPPRETGRTAQYRAFVDSLEGYWNTRVKTH